MLEFAVAQACNSEELMWEQPTPDTLLQPVEEYSCCCRKYLHHVCNVVYHLY